MLSQENAEKLMKILKKIKDPELFRFPDAGHCELDIVCQKERNSFPTNINRGNKNPSKTSYNMRYKSADNATLYRLDINGAPHKNPDDEIIPSPHLHVYREGANATWAIPAPPELSKSNVPAEALIDFLKYCNIMNLQAIAVEGDLFE